MSVSNATVLPRSSAAPSVARAFPNIALMKYWGKADDGLHIPTTSSISITLDTCPTTTSVALARSADNDEVFFGEHRADPSFTTRVTAFLQLIRNAAGDDRRACVRTRNEIPTAAGLASSASGFAALAVAAADAYGLQMTPRELSRLARRGSGSAARSLVDRFAIWHRGDDDESSYAEPLRWPSLDLAIVIVGVDLGPKAVASGAAMQHTMRSSPFYWPWVEQSHLDLDEMLVAGDSGDVAAVGEIAERNALAMHATMLGARPPIRYMSSGTLEVLDHVRELRAHGTPAHCTMDAGPNVKVICSSTERERIADSVRARWPHYFCATAVPGLGAALVPAKEAST